jgi:hypothetical protein
LKCSTKVLTPMRSLLKGWRRRSGQLQAVFGGGHAFRRPQLVGNTQPQGWGRRARAGAACRGLGCAGWTQRAGGGVACQPQGGPFASSWRTLKCGAPVLLRGNTLWETCSRVRQSGWGCWHADTNVIFLLKYSNIACVCGVVAGTLRVVGKHNVVRVFPDPDVPGVVVKQAALVGAG